MRGHFTALFSRISLVLALLAALLGSAVQVTPVQAASIVVNSNADTDANDGSCTLREAILAAINTTPRHSAPGECAAGSAGADTISFAGNYTITVGSQLPFITTPITITGRGAANTIIQAAPSPDVATWRVFQVTLTGNLTLDGVTVRHGRCSGSCTVEGGVYPNGGGGIYNSGTLTVTNSTISGNRAWRGAGIYNSNLGMLTVTNSTISGNTAADGGGGIYNYNLGNITVTYSTISGNTASAGGGIWNSNSSLTVTNSTIWGNIANGPGGGVLNGGSLTVTNSTFSGNSSGDEGGGILNFDDSSMTLTNSTIAANNAGNVGGGISNYTRAVTVANSTIAGNSASVKGGGLFTSTEMFTFQTLENTIIANNSGGNCFGVIPNGGNNLDSGATCGWGTANGSTSNTNPKLVPLANYGGPTETMALLTGSPAIDKGDASSCSSFANGVDQRGVIRPQGANCDIGAYEYNGIFADVPLNYWSHEFIERLYGAGITGGCGVNPLRYCPEATVTRAQMAVFLLRGIHGSAYNPPAVGYSTSFVDVLPSYWAAAWIEKLADDGITLGCGTLRYCPEDPVTRAQMAVFLLRSKHGVSYRPPSVGSSTGFSDVPPTYWASAWIKQLVAEGITSGCSAGNYCPDAPVTRAQMAVFLVRTFSLSTP